VGIRRKPGVFPGTGFRFFLLYVGFLVREGEGDSSQAWGRGQEVLEEWFGGGVVWFPWLLVLVVTDLAERGVPLTPSYSWEFSEGFFFFFKDTFCGSFFSQFFKGVI